MATVGDVVHALSRLTGGRMVTGPDDGSADRNPFVVLKDSGIRGKSVLEWPGLVWGDPGAPARRIGVAMTMSECTIELAHARGVDVIIAHHPVADAASSGGVPLAIYLPLYRIAVIECHEALHGLHPGIPWLHGHLPEHVDVAFGGLPGNVVAVGRPLPGIRTAGDILTRLETLLDRAEERHVLATEQAARSSPGLGEAAVANPPRLLVGAPDAPVTRILQVAPHSGFSVANLEQALARFPGVDTLVAGISRVPADHPLVAAARRLGLTMLLGNTHALEILENGLPLAYALAELLPGVQVEIFRERVTAAPLAEVGGAAVREYARLMSRDFLVARARGLTPGAELSRVHNPSAQEGTDR